MIRFRMPSALPGKIRHCQLISMCICIQTVGSSQRREERRGRFSISNWGDEGVSYISIALNGIVYHDHWHEGRVD